MTSFEPYEYERAHTLGEALAMLQEPGATILAGGTDLLPRMRSRRVAPRLLVDIKPVPELQGVTFRHGRVELGALVTATRLVSSPPALECLGQAAARFGCSEIRHRATIGGNLGNASPGGEFTVPLVALDAEVVVAGPGGTRVIPVEQFLRGPGRTSLEPGELVVSVIVPDVHRGMVSHYARVSRTKGMDLAGFSLAVVVRDANDPEHRKVAISMGAVAEVPPRAHEAEELLSGVEITDRVLARAKEALVDGLAPRAGSLRASPWYKLQVLPVLLERALVDLGLYPPGQGRDVGLPTGQWPRDDEQAGEPVGGGLGADVSPSAAGHRGARSGEPGLTITINGEVRTFDPHRPRTLLELLRREAGLTGPKEGCGNGECGACTVILDSVPVRSCLVLAQEAHGREVVTVEGLSRDGEPGPVQQAFLDAGAVQCGFCTPGFVVAAHALLQREPRPDHAQILEALGGHLCRCTGYETIFRAVELASREFVAQGPGKPHGGLK